MECFIFVISYDRSLLNKQSGSLSLIGRSTGRYRRSALRGARFKWSREFNLWISLFDQTFSLSLSLICFHFKFQIHNVVILKSRSLRESLSLSLSCWFNFANFRVNSLIYVLWQKSPVAELKLPFQLAICSTNLKPRTCSFCRLSNRKFRSWSVRSLCFLKTVTV